MVSQDVGFPKQLLKSVRRRSQTLYEWRRRKEKNKIIKRNNRRMEHSMKTGFDTIYLRSTTERKQPNKNDFTIY